MHATADNTQATPAANAQDLQTAVATAVAMASSSSTASQGMLSTLVSQAVTITNRCLHVCSTVPNCISHRLATCFVPFMAEVPLLSVRQECIAASDHALKMTATLVLCAADCL